jgi:hypothetical protein
MVPRRFLWIVAGLGAFIATLVPCASAGAIGPTVTVMPNSGLSDGQVVTVAGSGFTIPTPTVFGIEECVLGAVAPYAQQCDTSTATEFLSNTDNYSMTYSVQRHITTPDSGTIDCGVANSCEILSGEAFGDVGPLASAPINFAAPQVDLAILRVRSISRVLPGQPVEVKVKAANEGPTPTTWDVVQTVVAGLIPVSAGCQRSRVEGASDCMYSSTYPKIGHSVKSVFILSVSPGFVGVASDQVCVHDENSNDADPNPANNCGTVTIVVR